jgi:hypothetical protein
VLMGLESMRYLKYQTTYVNDVLMSMFMCQIGQTPLDLVSDVALRTELGKLQTMQK